MIDKYFNKRFKTLRGVRIAIFLKRIYDWFRLTRNGEKILSQQYHITGNLLGDGEDYYKISNLIVTANMLAELEENYKGDPISDLEEALHNEMNEN